MAPVLAIRSTIPDHRESLSLYLCLFTTPVFPMEDVIVALGGTAEATAEPAVARKTCTKCNTSKTLTSFSISAGTEGLWSTV
jgi:hypothetical protein